MPSLVSSFSRGNIAQKFDVVVSAIRDAGVCGGYRLAGVGVIAYIPN